MYLQQIAILAFVTAARVITASVVQEPTYVQRENIVYGEADGVGLVMDIFIPARDGNGRGIIDVISGAWHSDRGKIRDHARAQTFQILCGKGYTVFAVRPGSITKFSAPEMLAHINDGIHWVKEHADDYKIDRDRLGLTGASAGGHLACLAAVTAERGKTDASSGAKMADTRVKAVAVFFPITDFLNYNGKALDVRSNSDMAKLVRGLAFPKGVADVTDLEINQTLRGISPARLVTPQSPPFLLIHGDADPAVPLQQSETMVAALKQANVPAELIVKHGGGHRWLTIHEEVKLLADWFDKKLLPK
jgi:dipeptidyl aminopeptidase/acylaminoacyl peptidase